MRIFKSSFILAGLLFCADVLAADISWTIVTKDLQTGTVTARDSATGQTYEFQVTNQQLLDQLNPGTTFGRTSVTGLSVSPEELEPAWGDICCHLAPMPDAIIDPDPDGMNKTELRRSLAPVPQSTPIQQRPIPVGVKSTAQLSQTVKESIERLDTELRTSAMKGLNSMEKSSLGRVVYLLRAGDQTAGQREWQSMIQQATARSSGSPLDVNALIQHVLRESYLETNKDLQFYAEKVRYFNELKQEIREHLTHIRKHYSEWTMENSMYPNRARPQIVLELLAPPTAKLPLNISYRKKELGTKSEWEAYIEELEQKLTDVGDDAQLANIDLQNALQKQQQTLQTMSNISKILHDTAMAIIRKIG